MAASTEMFTHIKASILHEEKLSSSPEGLQEMLTDHRVGIIAREFSILVIGRHSSTCQCCGNTSN